MGRGVVGLRESRVHVQTCACLSGRRAKSWASWSSTRGWTVRARWGKNDA